jgi:Tol biopolymer transport system component
LDIDGSAALGPSSYLFFVRQSTLYAQPFDLERNVVAGDAVTIADGIAASVPLASEISRSAMSVSPAGTISYRVAASGDDHELAWFDRLGRKTPLLDAATAGGAELSPDDRRLAISKVDGGNLDVWIIELATRQLSRFTFGAGARLPVWSPDGRRIAFAAPKGGSLNLYARPASGATNETPRLESADVKVPLQFSPDGRVLLYRVADPVTGFDLWALPLDQPGARPEPVAKTRFDEREGQFSLDGKWIA